MTLKRTNRPVFDASAVLALLQGEKGSDKLAKLQPDALVSAVSAAEVLAKLTSQGMPVREAIAALDALHLEMTSFEPRLAAISAQYLHKGVSLGARCFLATARQSGCGWTSDRDLASLADRQVTQLKFFR